MYRRLAFCTFVALLAYGQSERGNITGIVTDVSGASVPNVPVILTNMDTNTSERVNTTTSGEYNAPNLAPGKYRIEISTSGFKRFIEQGITLTAGATVRLDAQLQVGLVTEAVEVQAQAVQMQTENAKVSTAVQNVLVDELPLVVGGALRSPFDL